MRECARSLRLLESLRDAADARADASAPALPSPDLTVSVSVADAICAPARDEVLGVELEERPPFPVGVAAPPRDERLAVEVGVGVGATADRRVRDLRARLVQDDVVWAAALPRSTDRAAQDSRKRADQTSSQGNRPFETWNLQGTAVHTAPLRGDADVDTNRFPERRLSSSRLPNGTAEHGQPGLQKSAF